MSKWDHRFLELAQFVAQWSKDPSTQVGAAIVDTDLRVVSLGYNGLARGVKDYPERYEERETKLAMMVHAERNALLFARQTLAGCAIYTWPFSCCSQCAAMVIQAGITRIVSPPLPERLQARWGKDLELAKQMCDEAGVRVDLL